MKTYKSKKVQYDSYLIINKMENNEQTCKIIVPNNAIRPFNIKTDIVKNKTKKLFMIDEELAKLLESKL